MRINNPIKNDSYSHQSTQSGKYRLVRKSARKLLKTNVNNSFSDKISNMSSNCSSLQSSSMVSSPQINQSLTYINQQKHNILQKRNQEEKSYLYQSHHQRGSDLQQKLREEKRNYRNLNLQKTKELRKLSQENRQLQNNNKILIEKNNKLEGDKEQLTKRIKSLEEQILKASFISQEQGKKISSLTSINPNPFAKLKNIKAFSKSNPVQHNKSQLLIEQIFSNKDFQLNSKKEYQQKWYLAQRNLFEARQTIKRLTLQIDCIRMKAFTDLQELKKQKNNEYILLQKRFKQLLNSHIEIVKDVRKKQITNKVKLAAGHFQTLHKKSSSDLTSILTLSSDSSPQ